MAELHPAYINALVKEISSARPDRPISSVYFGGGTPTILRTGQLTTILDAIRTRFAVETDAEITLEANPGTLDPEKLQALRRAGFNRISLGVQSFEDEFLHTMGRIHTAQQALDAYTWVREAGFDNIGIDLIYALPGQSRMDWQRALDRAVLLGPEHISLYELSIEAGTVYAERLALGSITLPSEDDQLEMYEAAIRTLSAAGYERYEVSNFARPGFRSRHNQVYWRNESYYGFGAGAVRYLDGHRCTLVKTVPDYIKRIEQGHDTAESCEELTGRALMGETIMLALRTIDGIDLGAFEQRFGVSLLSTYEGILRELKDEGMVELTDTHLKLTYAGMLLADRIAQEFLEISS